MMDYISIVVDAQTY